MPARQKFFDDLTLIKSILRSLPDGMTVTEIARAINKTKNTVGRYLDVLHASGQVEMRSIGMAKVCTLSHRVPLAQLISQAPEMGIILDNDLRILQANDIFLRFLHLQGEDVIEKSLCYLPFGDPGSQEMISSLVESIHTGKSDTSLLILNGGEHFFKIRTVPTVFEDGSQGSTVIIIDLTATKKAENALRESERNYRELVEHANSIILKMDTEGRVTFFNEFAEQFFGLTKEEVLGKNVIGTIVPPTESSGRDLSGLIRKICSGAKEYQNNENENITRNGRRVWIRWTNRPILDEKGNPIGILSVGNDITERRQMEELLKRQAQELEQRVKELRCLYWISELIEREGSIEIILQGLVELFPMAFQYPAITKVRIDIGDRAYGHLESGEVSAGLQEEIRVGDRPYGSVRVYYRQECPEVEEGPFFHEEKELVGVLASRLGRLIAHRKGESALQQERDFSTAILSALDALVVVLVPREGL